VGVASVTGRHFGTKLRCLSGRCVRALLLCGWVPCIAYHAVKWRQERSLALRLRSMLVASCPELEAAPRVSILVAAWNEREIIERHINSVLALRYPDLEYVLCAGGTDGTYERAKAYEGARVIVLRQRHGEGKQAALRRCLDRTTGEIVYLTDADCLLSNESIERTIAPIVREKEVATTGRSCPLDEFTSTPPLVALQYYRETYAALRTAPYSPGFLGRNCAIRRDVLTETHGFDADARTGTDYRLARTILQAGYRIRSVPTSLVATRYPADPRAYGRQQSRWLRNLFVHGAATNDWTQVRAAVATTLAGCVLLVGPVLGLIFGRAVLTPWISVTMYALSARVYQVCMAERALGSHSAAMAMAWIPTWLMLDSLVWASQPVQLISRRWRIRW
jgi:cellulose synthase/poly-beta-1,6-N-acetylglucosamine synthase-like glycosyltransferase